MSPLAGTGRNPVPFFDLARQHAQLGESLTDPVDNLLLSGNCVLGPAVARLEEELASWSGTARSVGVSSGTDALQAVLLALGIGPGDEVVTTPFTFVATAQAIVRCGAKPVFADIDPASLNLDPIAAEAACGPRTRAILAVHLFGLMSDVESLAAIARRRGIHLVEDAAQAFGASRSGRFAGSWGVAGCHSFYPTKVLGAAGDAGAVCASDPDLVAKIRQIRTHGADPSGSHRFVGGNFRMDALQALILQAKLPGLPRRLQARREHSAAYGEALGATEAKLPSEDPAGERVWSQYCLRHAKRDALRSHLASAGIGTGIYYATPLHLEPCFSFLGHSEGSFPIAEGAAREILALPLFPELREDERARTIQAVLDFERGAP